MGYSFEDFFDDHLAGKLIDFVRDYQEPKHPEDIYEKFFDILRDALNQQYNRRDDFARRLLKLIADDEMDMTPDQFVKRSFQLRYEELEIRKLEYQHPDGTIIKANYRGEQKEKKDIYDNDH